MATIKHLNETNKILQNNIATKDATITELKQALNDRSNITILPSDLSLIIVVPSTDALDQNNGKAIKFKLNLYHFIFRRNGEDEISK